MNVTVLGCGRWGTFLAWYANKIGCQSLLWGRDGSAKLKALREMRANAYLTLPEEVRLSDSLEEAVAFGDTIIISISSQSLRALGRQIRMISGIEDKTFVLCMKGIEAETGMRLSEVLRDEIGNEPRVAVWVGPGHVQDFVADIPNCMVIGSEEAAVSRAVVEHFNSPLIRFYYGEDLLGIEIGAAAKNVVGIAAGMLDGLGCGCLKGALMARGARELSRLVAAMGGDAMTVYGLSHLGDYEATLFSPHSNNRMFGERYVRGEAFEKLAEGVQTAKAMLRLAQRYHLEMPITRAVHDILFDREDPREKLLSLFLRPVKAE